MDKIDDGNDVCLDILNVSKGIKNRESPSWILVQCGCRTFLTNEHHIRCQLCGQELGGPKNADDIDVIDSGESEHVKISKLARKHNLVIEDARFNGHEGGDWTFFG